MRPIRGLARPGLVAAGLAIVLLAAATAGAVRLRAAPAASPRQERAAAPARMPGSAHRVAAAHAKRSIEIAGVGDMTFGQAGAGPPGGAAAVLARVTDDLRSDLTVGNLETTLGAGGTSKCSPGETACFAFQARPETADALRRAGFAAVNLANNHTNDYGTTGQEQTNRALHAARLAYTGRPTQTTYLVRRGIKVALLGFAPYDYDQNLLDIPAAVALVRKAATRAQLVVVFIHAGAEGSAHQHLRRGMETFLGERRGDSIRFAHAVVDAGADLVLGSGPHVLRAMEWYRGRLLAYSLGNFTGYHTLNTSGVSGISVILHVRLAADGSFRRGSLTPIQLVGAGTPLADPSRAALELVDDLSRSDLGARGLRISPGGRLQPPHAP